MTRCNRIVSALMLAPLAGAFLAAGAQAPRKAPAPAPVKPAAIPAFQETTLSNGLRVMLVESKRQPVVSIALMMPAGDAYDPAGKEGLAGIVAGVLTKGAGARSADQVSTAIENVGGSIGASTTPDFMNVRANVLAENAPLAFELVADAVARPAFESKEVELARTQTLSGLQLEQSQPASLAARFYAAQLFGAHPYGKRPTPITVRSLSVDDLRAFQKSRLVPSGALLVVAGDISMARTKELGEKSFGSWKGSAPAAVKRPALPTRTKTEILLIHRPGSVQSNILVGNLTYAPSNPSFYALTVASRILGGGTDGRLFKILREKKSWTYGAYSALTRNFDIGTFDANAEVRNAVTDSALTELLALERSLGSTPAPTEELEAAKGGLVGGLPLQLETAQGIAEQVGRFTMLGLPKDFIRTLRPRLASVTASQVQAAAKSYMRADQALIVVVGDGEQIYDKLAKIAPTKIVNAQGDAMQPADLVVKVTSLPVDLTKLAARTDSFVVLAQGNPFGFQTTTLSKTPTGYSYRTVMQLAGGMLSQATETSFGNDLAPSASTVKGKVQGQDVAITIAYAGGRAKGTASTPSQQGPKTVTIDTTLAPGVLDENMIPALVPGLRWAPNAKFTATVFDGSTGKSRQASITVAGTESVTVPAGTFPVYRVEMTGEPAQTIFVTTAAPHRVVKISMPAMQLDFVLVK
ncbi:MAG: insulinase family protein [Gemmatimonadota bacterium]